MGGSESRFILGHYDSSRIAFDTKPSAFLHVKNGSKGTLAMAGTRNPKNRLQKIRLQPAKGGGAYIRFDRHPQPALRVTGSEEGNVELYNASDNTKGIWNIAFLKVKNGHEWKDVGEKPLDLWADNMKKVQKCRVVIQNNANGGFLTVNEKNEVVTVQLPIHQRMNAEDMNRLQDAVSEEYKLIWELEYVNSQWSSAEVGAAVFIPAAVATAGVATFAGPIFGTAAFFNCTGISALVVLPMVQAAGAKALNFLAFTVVAGMLKKLA
ncbi:predicted protein [Chaetoceros tenuissimus]|uniref:Uncharacterized protein n=1 Tax=Chaetoceros tenuissimus TaxID=426638 RepID=A0AAD3CS93_9STRA|nr:predicted protein [Chaetoceros tenuissimus]